MGSIEFKCPGCGEVLEATDDMLGTTVECPSCQKQITVPGGGVPAAEGTGEKGVVKCLNCGAAMAADAVLCVHCGFHSKLNKIISTDLS